MLVLVPYKAPEKKTKGTRGGLRPKGTSDMVSEDAETHSSAAEDDEEEEEEEEGGGEEKEEERRRKKGRRKHRGVA